MKREKWKFQFKTEDVKVAAEAKVKFHQERHAWWGAKKEEVMKEIKEGGVSIDESIVDELGKTGYAGYQTLQVRAQSFGSPQVRIDPQLVQRLSECHGKIQEHKEKVKDYSAWVEVLSAGSGLLTLDHEDYLFFYGK